MKRRRRFWIRVPFEVAWLLLALWLMPWLVVLLNPGYWRAIRDVVFPWCTA